MHFLIGAVALFLRFVVHGHPLCLDNSNPTEEKRAQLNFCQEIKDSSNPDGSCCNAEQEAVEKARMYDKYNLSDRCKPYQRQVACARCHPYSTHILQKDSEIMGMSNSFCQEYYDACRESLNLQSDFCSKYATNDFYAYPFSQKQGSSNITPFFKNLGDFPSAAVGAYVTPDNKHWWVIQHSGIIYRIDNNRDATYTKKILDITDQVLFSGEMGLVGFAFSPDFISSKVFYIYFISNSRRSTIARYKYNENDMWATRNSRQTLLDFYQPAEIHHAGTLLFKPDDYANYNKDSYELFITSGDGGPQDDPNNNAQRPETLLGAILRIRVKRDFNSRGYENPQGNVRGEVWAYGVRNPWKASFDRAKRDAPEMWFGDVGSFRIEEVNVAKGGENFGWRNYEGTVKIMGDSISYTKPVYQYCHQSYTNSVCNGKPFTGQSVTGGFVYRGKKYAGRLTGQYIFADYETGGVYRLFKSGDKWEAKVITSSVGFKITSLAEDNQGEIYIVGKKNLYELPDTFGISVGGDHYTPGNDSSDSTCESGIQDLFNIACCPKECGKCGGFGCDKRPGGPSKCCVHDIFDSKRFCNNNSAPCITKEEVGRCKDGTLNYDGSVCCPKSCGKCGGFGCELRPGGKNACCQSGIEETERYCIDKSAPCIV